MRTQPATDTEPLRFRAATLDEAIEQAERSLGARTRVVSANHVRRGGIAGFFAADLGVEIGVVLEDETVEEALSRIVDEAATRERDQPREIDDRVSAATATVPPFAEALRMADEQTTLTGAQTTTPAIHPAQRSADVVDTFTPEHLPLLPVSGSTRPRAAFAAAASLPVIEEPQPAAAVTVAAPGDSKIERLEAAFASLRASSESPGVRNAAPTRRQVELVVIATEQIIDTITQHHESGKLRVRVAMRSSSGAEVEVQAEWDGNAQVTA